MKSLSQHLNEALTNEDEVHYYGADDNRSFGSIQTMPWKNAKALSDTLTKYFIKPDVKSKLSTSRVTISPGSSQYITFNAKDGFDKQNVIDVLKQPLERFAKVNSVKVRIAKFDKNSFSLNIIKSYSNFTDDRGYELKNPEDVIA